jgi:hypothetical protein
LDMLATFGWRGQEHAPAKARGRIGLKSRALLATFDQLPSGSPAGRRRRTGARSLALGLRSGPRKRNRGCFSAAATPEWLAEQQVAERAVADYGLAPGK